MARKYHAIIDYFIRNKDQIITGKTVKAKELVSPVTEEKINNSLFKY
jgi:hypothetical protein